MPVLREGGYLSFRSATTSVAPPTKRNLLWEFTPVMFLNLRGRFCIPIYLVLEPPLISGHIGFGSVRTLEIEKFLHPLLILEYCHDVWYGQTKMLWLPVGEKNFEGTVTRFDKIHERDRQTDK